MESERIRIFDSEQYENQNLRLPQFFNLSAIVHNLWRRCKKPLIFESNVDMDTNDIKWVEIIEEKYGGPYVGQFNLRTKQKVGVGIYKDKDGSIREGVFDNDKQVRGSLYSSKNYFGQGFYNEDGELEGDDCGYHTPPPNEKFYAGKFSKGHITSGKLFFQNKTIIGEFENWNPVGDVLMVKDGDPSIFHYGPVNKNYKLNGKGQVYSTQNENNFSICGTLKNGIMKDKCFISEESFDYVGSYFLGVFHGYGEIIFQNEFIYFGNFKFGKPHDDNCKIYYFNGFLYEGSYHKETPNGKGTLYNKKGYRYQGNWEKGILELSDDVNLQEDGLKELENLIDDFSKFKKKVIVKGIYSIAIGYFLKNSPNHSRGLFVEYLIVEDNLKERVINTIKPGEYTIHRLVFEDVWLKGSFNDTEVIVDSEAKYLNGGYFKGKFDLDKGKGKEGQAKIVFIQGFVFVGNVKNYIPSGEGKLKDCNTDITYEGIWNDGKLIQEDNEIYIQEFSQLWVLYIFEKESKNGFFYGTGYYCNGASAEGNFKMNKFGKFIREGLCDFKYQDTCYNGEYKNDLPDGSGTCSTNFVTFTGAFEESIWKTGIAKVNIEPFVNLVGCFRDVFNGKFVLSSFTGETFKGIIKKSKFYNDNKLFTFKTHKLTIQDIHPNVGKKTVISNNSGMIVIQINERKGILPKGDVILENRWRGKLRGKLITKAYGEIIYGKTYEVHKQFSFEGSYKFGMKSGRGIINFKNGEKYDGDWFVGMKHGIGKYFWPDGSSFEGSFKQNRKTGYGRIIFKNGEKYEGEWFRDNPHGKGTYYDSKGRVIKEGQFHLGNFINN